MRQATATWDSLDKIEEDEAEHIEQNSAKQDRIKQNMTNCTISNKKRQD